MKGVLRFFATVAGWCIGIAFIGACFRNVFGNSLEVEQKAAVAACSDRPGCGAQMTRIMRTPIEHSYAFVARGRPVEVDCKREFILFGDYTCKGSASELPHLPSTSAPVVNGKTRR